MYWGEEYKSDMVSDVAEFTHYNEWLILYFFSFKTNIPMEKSKIKSLTYSTHKLNSDRLKT